MSNGPDLCRAVRGKPIEGGCEVDNTTTLFKHCTAVGGKLQGGKCIISEERLRQLIEKK